MSESNRNSLKLDIVGARSAPGGGGDAETKRETYKAIPEDDRIPESRKGKCGFFIQDLVPFIDESLTFAGKSMSALKAWISIGHVCPIEVSSAWHNWNLNQRQIGCTQNLTCNSFRNEQRKWSWRTDCECVSE